ncbi:BTAD domain-containing putative transcriptional regulator [Saccharothrix variisporea]|uniref:DNA-binding SARP family transcriptional activator n=1 Tax=Saccharothrix variisporea TaxID=543527 RepID=A0A495X4K0_9PSEU|nr:BTAD domain-containing putative transcriptional regulator [Saccharothrix variisporea]RKT67553.1 DNA-binding SARP family transcriptional activator [Saccharothrix variisporea]
MQATCRVRVLGGFGVAVDGRPVPTDAWRSRRAADLVKLLAIESGHRMHREQAMDLLWPGLSAEAAGANLRKAVHYARRALGGPDAIAVTGHVLALWPGADLDCDLERFDRAADAALASGDATACTAAAALYPGDLLPDDRYEWWAEERRTKVRTRYLALLRAAGDWARLLEWDETDEEAHRALMRQHLAAGRRREALRQFEQLRRALRERIGVGPDAETVALYESALAEGGDPPSVAQTVGVTLANGLVAWGRRNLEEAERLAKRARALALDANLGHELGEASTLLALVAYARGTWHEQFRREFVDSVRRSTELEAAVFDAHLCFQEFYLYGPEGHEGAEAFGRDLLAIATDAGSAGGRALAHLLLGEFALLSGHLDDAVSHLSRSLVDAERAGCASARCIALERAAEASVRRGDRAFAVALLERAMPLARASGIRSHLVIRVHGLRVLAAGGLVDALSAVREGERLLASEHVCDPCSMVFRTEAARACARADDLGRARRHLAEAERIGGLWQGGPWTAALWEVRAELRRAAGQTTQASALFLEAADQFAALRRPWEERRCRAAAELSA